MTDTPFIPAYLDALFAFEALSRGHVFTLIEDRFNTVSEEILWSETSPAVGAWVPSPWLEARLLAGLGVAASMALVDVAVMPAHGDRGTYVVRWQRSCRTLVN